MSLACFGTGTQEYYFSSSWPAQPAQSVSVLALIPWSLLFDCPIPDYAVAPQRASPECGVAASVGPAAL